MKYESYINQIVDEYEMNLSEPLLTKNGETITIEDFVEKTKQMQPWHRRLLNNFAELREEHRDIKEYMRHYTEEKINDGFNFKKH